MATALVVSVFFNLALLASFRVQSDRAREWMRQALQRQDALGEIKRESVKNGYGVTKAWLEEHIWPSQETP